MTMAQPTVPTGNTYDKYGSSNPIERRLMQGFFASLEACLPATAPARVLEIGVGEAEVARRLAARWPGTTIIGLDLPDPALSSAWDDSPIHGLFGDVAHLPFTDGRFDLVLGIEVLEHVEDPAAALGELARVASANASVVVSVPREPVWRAANLARGKYVRDLGNTPGHIQHWGRQAFAELVGGHFEVTSVRSPFPWTMVAARAGRRST
jgi:ubiquinone/menaquinone biosynthesis C-methylase UbiE